jgi:hypothetical protein
VLAESDYNAAFIEERAVYTRNVTFLGVWRWWRWQHEGLPGRARSLAPRRLCGFSSNMRARFVRRLCKQAAHFSHFCAGPPAGL